LRLRRESRSKSRDKQQWEEAERAMHVVLDAVSVARDDNLAKVLQQKRLLRKGTTTNRRGTKTSTTFCVFLLTGNKQTLILRFQIRGTWKRQADRVEDAQKVRKGSTKPARVLNKKIEREVEAPRPSFRRGICCEAE
jgi:hypothetical protein